MLLLVVLLAAAACGAGVEDPSYHWGQYAYQQCRVAVKEAGEKSLPRGLCDAIQETLEAYIEATGYQLAEAMSVSFTRDVAKRLLAMPFRLTGEQGIQSTIDEMIRLKTRDVKEIEKHLGTWGSSWLLKASADDKQGQMPPGMAAPGSVPSTEELQQRIQQMHQQQDEANTENDEDDDFDRKEL